MSTSEPSGQNRPLELLERQTQLLTGLSQQVEGLRAQNEALTKAIEAPQRVRYVKIVDVNMPFWALVGFILKISFAAIPAYLILGFIAAIIAALLGGGCAALGSL
jgi:hypothetical protein